MSGRHQHWWAKMRYAVRDVEESGTLLEVGLRNVGRELCLRVYNLIWKEGWLWY